MSTVDESASGQEFEAPQQDQERKLKPKQASTGRWRPGRRARWGGAVAVTVLIAGGAVAAAAHHGFEEHEDRASAHADGRGHGHTRADRADGHDGGHDGGHEDGHEGGRNDSDRRADDAGPHLAPAPLPSLDAADAVVKASSAVPGGKVESLHPVSATGGGRAWQAVVLGPDGVRQAVTVDGTTFAITANTVTGG
ncbi:hypothetical protein [Kitasatospora sp. MBT66]|uniref:hypothetical protein n=1 Tax=Kitasatospora sp. MBT66 TaxID=1444769 RepID=UPI0005B9EBCF|nr:hypothetical protein [Kitasatospora sp. MBT66]